jgi:protein-tyrosine-phosphatase
VVAELPSSILFCCDHNSVRSPMAEGLAKKIYGTKAYLQSAGVRSDREIDGFAIAVCAELGVELSRHRVRSFEEMQEWGDDLGGFDLIVALSPAAQRQALELTRTHSLDVLYWPVMDPTGFAGGRERQLEAYRQARDQIVERMIATWGGTPPAPVAGDALRDGP